MLYLYSLRAFKDGLSKPLLTYTSAGLCICVSENEGLGIAFSTVKKECPESEGWREHHAKGEAISEANLKAIKAHLDKPVPSK
jgi:hypothetical protein